MLLLALAIVLLVVVLIPGLGHVVNGSRRWLRVAGANFQNSTLDVFDVQSQAVIAKQSQIALTYGNATFAADAAHNNKLTPQLPIDAGRLILSPVRWCSSSVLGETLNE